MDEKRMFPDIITSLPEADMPFEGIEAYLLQGENQQVIFMYFDEEVEVPEHAHEEQWGIVLDGEIHVSIGGETQVCRRGDTYFIPKSVKHSARVMKGYRDITFFNQRDRYKVKRI
jgi:quercetin dioxygenase-like cupin family protein